MDGLCKVLIVEDEYITRQGIRNMIDWNAAGFEIVGEACNGKDALAMVEKLRPHIVLTDVVMPVVDGIELEKALRAKHPEIPVVVLSSYSDFDYVRDSFQSGASDYILKPTLSPDNLLKSMKQAASRIPGLTLRGRRNRSLAGAVEKLLTGFAGEGTRKQLAGAFREDGFLLAGTDLSRLFGRDAEAAERQKALLARAAEQELSGFSCEHLVVNESVLLLVVNFRLSEKESLCGALRRAAEKIAEQEPRTFYVASPVFSDISRMKEIYGGPFLRNLDQFFYYKNRHFMAAEEFRKPERQARFNLLEYTRLLDALQVEKALDLLEGYMRRALSARWPGEMELKTLVQDAWYQLLSVLEDQGLNADSLSYLKRECLLKLYSCSYADEFARVFSVLQADFRTIVGKYKVGGNGGTMRDILRYIDGHYGEPLTLTSLARRFNFNYSYLSAYFRSHHSEGFSEYLNRERIRHAMELLRQGTLSVSEVCGAVGYTDQSYFARVFKKETGSTPRDYRRSCRKAEG
jgi:two-component system response regulator YesN